VLQQNGFFNHFYVKDIAMNIKRVFGAILTILGIGGLIYAAIIFSKTDGGVKDVKSLTIFGILGLLFFISGLGLVRTVKDAT
jgi:uncharacterized membrane protein